jgi:hypothetical protein
MNPLRFVDLIAKRHPNNLMLLGQRRDDSDTPVRRLTAVLTWEVDGKTST